MAPWWQANPMGVCVNATMTLQRQGIASTKSAWGDGEGIELHCNNSLQLLALRHGAHIAES
jgi:hypothetical protein